MKYQKITFVSMLLGALEYMYNRIIRLFWFPTCNEEDVSGKVVIVTGANAGLGKTTAMEMAKRGAHVVMGCRNLKEGEKARIEIMDKTGNKNVRLIELDLADLASVKKFAAQVKKEFSKIHILINNAGVIVADQNKKYYTVDGFELHMGVNHLGPFLLTMLLLDVMKKTPSPSRIVFVSSSFSLLASLDLNDLMSQNKKYTGIGGMELYANSKLANTLISYELGERTKGTGVNTYSLCPGMVRSNIGKNLSTFKYYLSKIQALFISFSCEQGVETILYCALSKDCRNETGNAYWFSYIDTILDDSIKMQREMAKKLYTQCEELVGLKQKS